MLGYGGIRVVARAVGMDEDTVSRGARELDEGAEQCARVRARGGGRKRVEVADPGIVPVLIVPAVPWAASRHSFLSEERLPL